VYGSAHHLPCVAPQPDWLISVICGSDIVRRYGTRGVIALEKTLLDFLIQWHHFRTDQIYERNMYIPHYPSIMHCGVVYK